MSGKDQDVSETFPDVPWNFEKENNLCKRWNFLPSQSDCMSTKVVMDNCAVIRKTIAEDFARIVD